MQTPGEDDKNHMNVLDYETRENSAVCVTDWLKMEASEEEIESLKKSLETLDKFKKVVFSEFRSHRGYDANDIRYSDTFREVHFWFKDGLVMASIRSGSIG
jgi:hypothetical protein